MRLHFGAILVFLACLSGCKAGKEPHYTISQETNDLVTVTIHKTKVGDVSVPIKNQVAPTVKFEGVHGGFQVVKENVKVNATSSGTEVGSRAVGSETVKYEIKFEATPERLTILSVKCDGVEVRKSRW